MSNNNWIEQMKVEMTQSAKDIVDNSKNIERKIAVGYIDHKCTFCKKNIPHDTPLIRITEKIYNRYSETPFWKTKYFCNEDCENGKTKEKEQVPAIPEGYEVVN